MRVYHFTNAEFGLKILQEKRLKISHILKLNDPFEFSSLVESHDLEFRNAMEAGKQGVAEIAGIICFSANWKNPVQWAHYADRHTGLCLGFDIPDENLEKILYVKERVPHNGKFDESGVIELMTTKYEDWGYEEEYRVFIPFDQPDDADGLYYSDFHENLKLVTVIVGVNSYVSCSAVVALLGNLNGKVVEVFKAKPHSHKFEMTRDQNENLFIK